MKFSVFIKSDLDVYAVVHSVLNLLQLCRLQSIDILEDSMSGLLIKMIVAAVVILSERDEDIPGIRRESILLESVSPYFFLSL